MHKLCCCCTPRRGSQDGYGTQLLQLRFQGNSLLVDLLQLLLELTVQPGEHSIGFFVFSYSSLNSPFLLGRRFLDWEVRLDCWQGRSHVYSRRKLGGLQPLCLRPKLPAGGFGGRLNENNLLQGRSTAKLSQAIHMCPVTRLGSACDTEIADIWPKVS